MTSIRRGGGHNLRGEPKRERRGSQGDPRYRERPKEVVVEE